jgi:trimeric autotransporter adhesin
MGWLRLIAIGSCFVLARGAACAAQIAAGSLTLSPATSGTLIVSYSSQGNSISGLQFDLAFNSGALSVIVVPGPAIGSAGKNLYTATLGAGSSRVLVAGLDQNSLSDGGILTIFVNVGPTAGPGSYTINLANAVGADPSGNAVSIPDASGAITISSQPGNGTAIQSGGILSAGSWLPGPVSPGEVVTLIGSGIGPAQPASLQLLPSGQVSTSLANTTVSFGSVQAPLIYAAPNQINAVVPFEVSGQTSTVLTIKQGAQQLPPITVPIAPATPALFTQNATGVGPVSALNQDWSLNTPLNPAVAGSVVTVYMTGTGQTNPPGLTGTITTAAGSTLLPTTATIGGLPAEVLYSGPAPGEIAGVGQINLRVPPGVNSSPVAPITIQIGTAVTQAGATLSIR